MTDEIGHTPKFWNNMKKILEVAIDLKIYKDVNYSEKPERVLWTNNSVVSITSKKNNNT